MPAVDDLNLPACWRPGACLECALLLQRNNGPTWQTKATILSYLLDNARCKIDVQATVIADLAAVIDDQAAVIADQASVIDKLKLKLFEAYMRSAKVEAKLGQISCCHDEQAFNQATVIADQATVIDEQALLIEHQKVELGAAEGRHAVAEQTYTKSFESMLDACEKVTAEMVDKLRASHAGEVAALLAESEQTATTCTSLRDELSKLKTAHDHLLTQSNELLKQLEAERGQLDSECGKLNAECGKLKAECGQLEAARGQLETERGKLKAECGKLNAERGKLDSELAALKAELAALKAECSKLKAECSKLESDRLELEATYRRLEATYRRFEESMLDRAVKQTEGASVTPVMQGSQPVGVARELVADLIKPGAIATKTCVVCMEPSSLKCCGVTYCSKPCQTQDWRRSHKDYCVSACISYAKQRLSAIGDIEHLPDRLPDRLQLWSELINRVVECKYLDRLVKLRSLCGVIDDKIGATKIAETAVITCHNWFLSILDRLSPTDLAAVATLDSFRSNAKTESTTVETLGHIELICKCVDAMYPLRFPPSSIKCAFSKAYTKCKR